MKVRHEVSLLLQTFENCWDFTREIEWAIENSRSRFARVYLEMWKRSTVVENESELMNFSEFRRLRASKNFKEILVDEWGVRIECDKIWQRNPK